MFFFFQKTDTSSYLTIIAFALILPACAYAESAFRSASVQKDLPADFQGVWLFANEENTKCNNQDFEKRENDGLIRISSSSVEEWESGGDVLSIHKVPIGSEGTRTVPRAPQSSRRRVPHGHVRSRRTPAGSGRADDRTARLRW
jgi:hypothetical protein